MPGNSVCCTVRLKLFHETQMAICGRKTGHTVDFLFIFKYVDMGIKRSVFHYFVKSFFSVKYNNFVLIDATDRSKINSDQKRLFFAVSLYPFYFSRTLPLIFSKKNNQTKVFRLFLEITSVSNLSKNIFHKCLL